MATASNKAVVVNAVVVACFMFLTAILRWWTNAALHPWAWHPCLVPEAPLPIRDFAPEITGSAVIAKKTGVLHALGTVSRSSVETIFCGCGLGKRGSLNMNCRIRPSVRPGSLMIHPTGVGRSVLVQPFTSRWVRSGSTASTAVAVMQAHVGINAFARFGHAFRSEQQHMKRGDGLCWHAQAAYLLAWGVTVLRADHLAPAVLPHFQRAAPVVVDAVETHQAEWHVAEDRDHRIHHIDLRLWRPVVDIAEVDLQRPCRGIASRNRIRAQPAGHWGLRA